MFMQQICASLGTGNTVFKLKACVRDFLFFDQMKAL